MPLISKVSPRVSPCSNVSEMLEQYWKAAAITASSAVNLAFKDRSYLRCLLGFAFVTASSMSFSSSF